MSQTRYKMSINPETAELKFIYSDELHALVTSGPSKTERVSNVEPTKDGKQWEATMRDGTVLGPFDLRSEALAAEVKYVEEKLLK